MILQQKGKMNHVETSCLIPIIRKFLMIFPYYTYLSKFSSAIGLILVLIQNYQFSQRPNISTLVKYGHFYCACFYIFNINTIYPIAMKFLVETEQNFKEFFIVNFNTISRKTTKEINNEVSKVHYVFIVWIFFAIVAISSTYWMYFQDVENTMLSTLFLKKFIPLDSAIALVFHWTIYAAILISIVPSIAIPLILIYLIFHVKLHLLMLIDYVDNVKHFLRHKPFDGEFVKAQIRLIVLRHLEIKRYNKAFHTLDFTLCILCYSITGGIVGFLSLITIFTPFFKTILGVVMFGGYFAVLVGATNFAQKYMDDSQNLANSIYNLQWYDWEVESQRMYLIMLTNMSEFLKISIFLTVDVNNDLLKKMCQYTYNVGYCFYSLSTLSNHEKK